MVLITVNKLKAMYSCTGSSWLELQITRMVREPSAIDTALLSGTEPSPVTCNRQFDVHTQTEKILGVR